MAAYWKNGTMVKLVNDSITNSYGYNIAVNGTDVYVTGYKINSSTGFGQAVYWKNGVITELSGLSGAVSTPKIIVSGSDVYVAGSVIIQIPQNSTSVPAYWKNGTPQTLQVATGDKTMDIISIAVSGNDVYLSGGVTSSTPGTIATYWKNGVENKLTSTLNATSYSRAITIQGNDVYVAGQTGNKGAYWKNGVINTVSVDNTSIFAIAVKDNDVYLAGVKNQLNSNNITTGTFATYWKNGIENQIGNIGTTGNGISLATSIYLNGDDVYITGGFNVSPASYLKNSILVPFSTNPNAQAYAMYVVNK